MNGETRETFYTEEAHKNFEPVQIPLDMYLQSQQLNQKLLAKVERLTKENMLMEDRFGISKSFAKQMYLL